MGLGRHGLALLLGMAVIGGSGAVLLGGVGIAAQGGLSQQTVQQLIEQQHGGASASQRFDWHGVQIAAPRKISNGEAAQEGIPPATTIYPVRADFTTSVGAGPSAMVRDVTAFYFFYKDDFGKWTAGQYAHQGTRNDLRGG